MSENNIFDPQNNEVQENQNISDTQSINEPTNDADLEKNVPDAEPKAETPETNTQPSGQTYTQGTYYSYTPNNFGGQYNNYQYSPIYEQKPPKKTRNGLKITLCVLAVIAVVSVAFFSGAMMFKGINTLLNKDTALSSSQNQDETSSFENLIINSKPAGADEYTTNSDGTMTAAAVIEKVRPSIVGIVQYQNSNSGIPVVAGQGSGIIISSDGYIVTNAHVVEGATMVTVVLDNDEEYRATLKGEDVQTDLAVLKIDAKGLSAADLGDSSQTVVGESVIAIGNPGGLELAGSCTGGMISGLDRTIMSDSTGYAMTYIQTDAAINPGNSGGALVNMYGQVIGINSAKISADGYENLGFAIPINEAIPIIDDLRSHGYVKNRAKIGIGFQLITQSVSQYYNYSIPAGLLITEIDESCDIATKDVQINDIITKIDGKDMTDTATLYTLLQDKKPGDSIKLTVYRIGTRLSTSKTFEVSVVLSEDKGEN